MIMNEWFCIDWQKDCILGMSIFQQMLSKRSCTESKAPA
jgi:hypothetical protein